MGVYSDRLKKRGLGHRSGSKRGVFGTGQVKKGVLGHVSVSKKGVLGTGQVKKGGLYRGTYLCWTYGICECPPSISITV